MRKIIPIIADKYSDKRYLLTMADYSHDYCKGITDEYPDVIFTFKLHNVDIKLTAVETK